MSSAAALSTSEVANDQVDDEEETDIWAQEPEGKQAYGAFSRKSKQVLTPKEQESDEELSPGSSDEDSEEELESKRVASSGRPGMTSMRQPSANSSNRYYQRGQPQKYAKGSGSKR